MEIVKEKITKKYDDWNYDAHRVIDTTPTEEDFMKTVFEFMSFEFKRAMADDYRKQGYSEDFASFLMKL